MERSAKRFVIFCVAAAALGAQAQPTPPGGTMDPGAPITAPNLNPAPNTNPEPEAPRSYTAPAQPSQQQQSDAEEQAPEGRDWRLLSLGLTTGYNGPGGFVGGSVLLRPLQGLGLGVAAGLGQWGARISPEARLGFGSGPLWLYALAGLSFNTGRTHVLSNATDGGPFTIDGAFTSDWFLGGGARGSLSIFYLEAHLGWMGRIAGNNAANSLNYTWRESPGNEAQLPASIFDTVSRLAPGGFMIAATAGIQFL
jgi:hypothetical protein